MAIFAFLFGVQVISLLMLVISLKRLYAYIRLYRFDESIYTLLFGFLHLRYFIVFYFVIVVSTVVVETIYAFSFFSLP